MNAIPRALFFAAAKMRTVRSGKGRNPILITVAVQDGVRYRVQFADGQRWKTPSGRIGNNVVLDKLHHGTYMQHSLKTWPNYFEAVWRGEKRFEIRKDDRGFKVGDDLLLEEFDPETKLITGRHQRFRITYIYRGDMVAPEHCVISIKKLPDIGSRPRRRAT